MHREEDSSVEANSSAVATTDEGGDAGVGGGGEEAKINRSNIDEGERQIGNRWPRQETLALLKIRSDMNQQFHGSSLKVPLWNEVSRKLAQLGYNKSSKKCREKFENVVKYHKRTKDGRNGKADGKTYRFFDQLAALENHPPPPQPPPPQKPQVVQMRWTNNPPVTVSDDVTVPSATTTNPKNLSQNIVTPPMLTNPTLPTQNNIISCTSNFPTISANLLPSSTSASTASDGEFQGRRKRKRKWKDFFERLTKQVMKKQEELESKFLETIEKREHNRMVREESWRMQEMSRISRKHEIFVQERSATAAKDAAVIAFLHQMSGSQPPAFHQTRINQEKPSPSPSPPPPSPPAPPQHHQLPPPPSVNFYTIKSVENVKENSHIAVSSTSSRWPKPEVQALITLRTSLDIKYQENEPKGPSWQEISAGMGELGYNRSAKRCKEKWENINKYFKKVKESNKQRPEDSKTCPYFHQLDALYKDKINNSKVGGSSSTSSGNFVVKPIDTNMEPLMVCPEQQWPLQQECNNKNHSQSVMEDNERSGIMDQNQEEETEEDGDTDDDDDEEEAHGFELVPYKQVSMAATSGE